MNIKDDVGLEVQFVIIMNIPFPTRFIHELWQIVPSDNTFSGWQNSMQANVEKSVFKYLGHIAYVPSYNI